MSAKLKRRTLLVLTLALVSMAPSWAAATAIHHLHKFSIANLDKLQFDGGSYTLTCSQTCSLRSDTTTTAQ